MIRKILNIIEANRFSKKLSWKFLVRCKDLVFNLSIYSTYLKIPFIYLSFLKKKVDYSCDSFSLRKEFFFYQTNQFKLPNKQITLRANPFGFFSNFMGVLGYLDFCEKNNYKPEIMFNTGLYSDKRYQNSWWSNYFDGTLLKNIETNPPGYEEESKYSLSFSHRGNSFISLHRKNFLFKKYISIKSDIQNEVERFAELNFSGFHIIGCHVRGTDKYTETGFSNSLEIFEKSIKAHLRGVEDFKIFLATDDEKIFSEFKNKFGDLLIVTDSIRSDKPVHHNYSDGYKLGREALIDCLLLSKCNYFIGSRSNLSHAVLVINPKIKHVIIKNI